MKRLSKSTQKGERTDISVCASPQVNSQSADEEVSEKRTAPRV